MKTTSYGSIPRPLDQSGNAEGSGSKQSPKMPDTPNFGTSRWPEIPLSIQISMCLIGMWRSCHHRDQPQALLTNEELHEEDSASNPTPDTSIGDPSYSEEIDFIAEAEILNVKKINFSIKSE